MARKLKLMQEQIDRARKPIGMRWHRWLFTFPMGLIVSDKHPASTGTSVVVIALLIQQTSNSGNGGAQRAIVISSLTAIDSGDTNSSYGILYSGKKELSMSNDGVGGNAGIASAGSPAFSAPR